MSVNDTSEARDPGVTRAAAIAWSDVNLVLNLLTIPLSIAFAFTTAFALLQELLRNFAGDGWASLTMLTLLRLLHVFFLTPYLIAVHRFVILGETASGYALTPDEPRFRTFFHWNVAVVAVQVAPGFLLLFAPSFLTIVTVLVGALAAFIWLLRLAILFPAIAVDAPSATYKDAMTDTKEYTWRIFLIGFLAGLPILVVSVFLAAQAEHPQGLSLQVLMRACVDGAASILVLTLCTVIAARLYERLGNHVRRTP